MRSAAQYPSYYFMHRNLTKPPCGQLAVSLRPDNEGYHVGIPFSEKAPAGQVMIWRCQGKDVSSSYSEFAVELCTHETLAGYRVHGDGHSDVSEVNLLSSTRCCGLTYLVGADHVNSAPPLSSSSSWHVILSSPLPLLSSKIGLLHWVAELGIPDRIQLLLYRAHS